MNISLKFSALIALSFVFSVASSVDLSLGLSAVSFAKAEAASKKKSTAQVSDQSAKDDSKNELNLPDDPTTDVEREASRDGVRNPGLLAEPESIYGRKGAILIGHNVTPSTELLKQGVWTVGNYAIALGLTDN